MKTGCRTGVELKLHNYFVKLLGEGKSANEAIDIMGYQVFDVHKDEFNKLNEFDEWEVRNYIVALWKLFK